MLDSADDFSKGSNSIEALKNHLLDIILTRQIPSEAIAVVASGLLMTKTIASIESKGLTMTDFLEVLMNVKGIADNMIETYIPLRADYSQPIRQDAHILIMTVALIHALTGMSPLLLTKEKPTFDMTKDVPVKGQSFEQMIKDILKNKRGDAKNDI